jgi:hypothetical protein
MTSIAVLVRKRLGRGGPAHRNLELRAGEIVSVITDSRVIDRILRHLRAQAVAARGQTRPPPT